MADAALIVALLAFAGSSASAVWLQVGREHPRNLTAVALGLFVCGLAAAVGAMSFSTNSLAVQIQPDRTHLHGQFGSRKF